MRGVKKGLSKVRVHTVVSIQNCLLISLNTRHTLLISSLFIPFFLSLLRCLILRVFVVVVVRAVILLTQLNLRYYLRYDITYYTSYAAFVFVTYALRDKANSRVQNSVPTGLSRSVYISYKLSHKDAN